MKRTRWKMALVNIVKKSLSEERKEKSVILNSKRSKTTKKNTWVDKDLTKQNETLTNVLKRTELYRML